MEYRNGQRVHIDYDGVIDDSNPSHNKERIIVRDSKGNRHFYTSEAVTITAVDPKDWPPQVGDVWLADGIDWYVRQYQGNTAVYVIEPFDMNNHPDEHYSDSTWTSRHKNVDEFKEMNPELVRRR